MTTTTQYSMFKNYEYGNNDNYYLQHNSYDSAYNIREGSCFSASYNFIYEVMNGKEIDICSRGTNLAKWFSKVKEYQEVALKNRVRSSYILLQMNYWMKKHSASFYQRGRQFAVVMADDPQRIISKIQKYPDRFPVGYVETYIQDKTLVHATAFASDRAYIYYFEPNFGFMKVERNDVQQLNDLFIESYRPDYRLRYSLIVYAKRPAVVQEPGLRLY